MTRTQLAAVREASQRERAHHADHVEMGCDDPVCYCPRCKVDRVTIAAALPDLLRYIDAADAIPRHEVRREPSEVLNNLAPRDRTSRNES